jgi:hypothetical protein
VHIRAGDIATLLTMTACQFKQLIKQYTLLLGLARILAILLNSWSRTRPNSKSSLLLKNRARSSIKDVICYSNLVALSMNSCILRDAEQVKKTDWNGEFSLLSRARPMSYARFKMIGAFDATLRYTPTVFERLPEAKSSNYTTFSFEQHVLVNYDKFGINTNAFACNFNMCICNWVKSGALIFRKEVASAFSVVGFFDEDCKLEKRVLCRGARQNTCICAF